MGGLAQSPIFLGQPSPVRAWLQHRLPIPANLRPMPNITALVNSPRSRLQARATAPPTNSSFGMFLPAGFCGESIRFSTSTEPFSPSIDLSFSMLTWVLIWAIDALRVSGAPEVRWFWYARRPGSIFLTAPHIPCRTPSFAISQGMPMSSWWKSNTSHAVSRPSIFDSTVWMKRY